MRRTGLVLFWTTWILGGLFLAVLPAQDNSESENEVEKRHLRMLELARSYTLQINSQAIELREKPLFRWSTPERQAIGGELYVWTRLGRPVATIGIWTYDDIRDSHELQSLATEPLTAVSARFPAWRPTGTCVTFRELQNVAAPASSAVRRQTQMRSMLREKFSGQMTQDDGAQVELRLLPQPLFRYETMPPDVIDGAMFGLAFGTDPEILVLIEARKSTTKDAPDSWYYAFAPSTSAKVIGRVDATEVWNNKAPSAADTFRMMIER